MTSPLVLLQATGVREDQLLVTVLPGLPTAAEFFLLPDKQLTEGKPEKSSAHLDQVRQQAPLCFYLPSGDRVIPFHNSTVFVSVDGFHLVILILIVP